MTRRWVDVCRRTTRRSIDRLRGADPGSRLAGGVFWSLLGGTLSQLLTFVGAICVARMLGGERYGELAMIRSTTMMGSLLAAFGIGLTATKHVAESRATNPERTGRIVVFSVFSSCLTGGLMAIVVYTLSEPVARLALHAPHLEGLIRFGTVLLVLDTVITAQTGVLAGFEAFRAMTRTAVTAGLFSVPILIAATLVHGLPGSVFGLTVGAAVHCFLNLRALWAEARTRGIPLSLRFSVKEWRTLGAFSIPIAFTNMITAPAAWASHVLLVNQVGGYLQMGIFNAANQWRLAILFVPQKIALTTLPVLSTLTTDSRLMGFRKTLQQSLLWTTAVACVLALPVFVLSPWIVTLYGPDFISGAPVLALLTASAILMSVNLVLERALASLGRVWFRFVAYLLWALVLATAVFTLVGGGGGAPQLALANLIASSACTAILFGLLFAAMRNHHPAAENEQVS